MDIPPLIEGRLLRRYKRFFADVELPGGEIVTAHCANTGRMSGVLIEGARAWLQTSDNPKRKLRYSWVLVEPATGQLACIDTGRANALVAEAIGAGRMPELDGYTELLREQRYGAENSRIDLLLRSEDRRDCYVEVKNVTLHLGNGEGAFPDAVSARGSKHLRELMHVASAGARAVILFHVAHSGIEWMRPAREIDPEYADTLTQAIASGVEVLVYGAAEASTGRWIVGRKLSYLSD